MRYSEPAPAKVNLALHVRGRRADGRHNLETLFAFCVDGDRLSAEASDEISLDLGGPFATALRGEQDNLVLRAARDLQRAAGVEQGAALHLQKNLPVASGLGGGSADAAAALRLLTRLWKIDPDHAAAVAPDLGADVPACLLSMTARGEGVGDQLRPVDAADISGTPILLVNPLEPLSTAKVFARWDGEDRGPLGEDWRSGRNDLEPAALAEVPAIGVILDWMRDQPGVTLARMSGSGASCFALFDTETALERGASACPDKWWHMASFLR
ncbi:4-(cytidine 5'-diphospho)-2-C-methyl-D-erythritol kinase [Sphingomicrobium lutaoense]|uniref:4-diphosphocytidyl-2-C-methyl-D-erythritol kinase n=1 Tax=Sphingomicrobium lutaoense TaxID=515949 RepID=A0A839YX36_9SPHN|nr:4-(cytidine 5'-diphospho)-2-C-methyl-D-erythritol kinase [Sphingomicrobium lutaoense]MBB3763749.1 4-diphosphocytidyl-2-C-methyl-D-erythritol kinase [Sphingomicrobium lutaoense]